MPRKRKGTTTQQDLCVSSILLCLDTPGHRVKSRDKSPKNRRPRRNFGPKQVPPCGSSSSNFKTSKYTPLTLGLLRRCDMQHSLLRRCCSAVDVQYTSPADPHKDVRGSPSCWGGRCWPPPAKNRSTQFSHFRAHDLWTMLEGIAAAQ